MGIDVCGEYVTVYPNVVNTFKQKCICLFMIFSTLECLR